MINRRLVRAALVFFMLALFAACGRIQYPFAPEDLAPEAVKELSVRASDAGVQFEWRAPESDLRGEKLRSLDGYAIERKTIVESADIVDEDVEFLTLATVADKYLVDLKAKEDFLSAKGLPKRRAQVDDSVAIHSYLDAAVESGTRYLYKITPINQGGEEGQVRAFIDVEYRGAQSEIVVSEELSDELIEE